MDPSIVQAARALVPRYVRLNQQKFAPHLSVIRHEPPEVNKHPRWGAREGESVAFRYSPEVAVGEVYYWLPVWSERLEAIRMELGLPPTDWYTKPPDLAHPFHCTIGNLKGV